jgi:enamine deaminase RidA (YjgF/YER057c/UK114 family)
MGKTAIVDVGVPVMGLYTPAYRLSDGELVMCSGIVPVDENGKTVGIGDAHAQARRVFTNLRMVLEAADATTNDVVALRVFSVDMNNRKAINEARLEVFGDPLPASTHVQIVRLVDPDWLLEIEATAFVLI